MLTLLCLIIPTTGLCSVFIFRHKTQTWWHHETGLTGLRHDSFKFWDWCRLLVILKYLLLLWLPGWLADWLWQSDVILCHQLYAAPPKYGIGIKGLPSACVCEHLLLFYSWSTDRRSNQTHLPNQLVSPWWEWVRGIKARWSKPCVYVWGGGLPQNMDRWTFVILIYPF